MAKFSLIPFDLTTAPILDLAAEINVTSESLFISYRLKSGLPLVDLGSPHPRKERVLKLWEKTCFEFFIKNEKDAYVEFNFSPSFEWNCFYFPKKGDALSEWEKMQRPKTDILLSEDHFFLVVEIKKDLFPAGFFDGAHELNVGLTSVIKEKSGQMSYWALHHSDTRPNFHCFDSFLFKYKF